METFCKSFSKLSVQELYDIMVLRQEVFVVEQNCPYQDADGKDQEAFHLMMYENKELVAYTRLLPAGISYENYASIGRVVNKETARGKGIGIELMKSSIEWIKKLFPREKIKISAQVYLLKFYTSLGFIEIGERYLEDGIPHMGMVLQEEK